MGALKWLLRAGVVAAAGLSAACGLLDKLTSPDELGVAHFTASSQEVALNDVVTLSWEVTGAATVDIDQGIGSVDQKGSQQVRMSRSARFTLTAESEGAKVTATLEVIVDGAALNPVSDPIPEATPDPEPDATPTPTPQPPPPASGVSCGDAAASQVLGCVVLITEHSAPPAGQCFEVTRVNLSESCPMSVGQQRNLEIDVTALTLNQLIKWRFRSADELRPFQGSFDGSGITRIEIGQTVRDSSVTIDFYDADDTPLKSVTIQNF